MDFLKSVYGEKALTFDEFVQAVNAHNGNEANKDNLIKLANLASGEYVGKGKYDALDEMLKGKQTELDTANGLIADLKKGAKGNEEMQGKITAYETQVQKLQEQLKQTQIEGEVKISLLSAKAKPEDIDYLIFKMKNSGKALELGEDGKIKGIEDLVSDLKTQCPNQFEASKGGFKVDANPLPSGDDREAEPQTLAEALKAQYGTTTN